MWLRRFPGLWQIMGMVQKKINFGRTTIARAKAAVKRHRAAKKKKARSQSKRQSKTSGTGNLN
jgi:sRNA-binding protein